MWFHVNICPVLQATFWHRLAVEWFGLAARSLFVVLFSSGSGIKRHPPESGNKMPNWIETLSSNFMYIFGVTRGWTEKHFVYVLQRDTWFNTKQQSSMAVLNPCSTNIGLFESEGPIQGVVSFQCFPIRWCWKSGSALATDRQARIHWF